MIEELVKRFEEDYEGDVDSYKYDDDLHNFLVRVLYGDEEYE